MDRFDARVEKPYKIRTQPFTYAIFGILIGPIFIAWVYIAHISPVASNRVGAAVAGGILAGVWLWFFSLEVDLCSDRLVMKTLFGKRQIIYSEIEKVDLIVRSARGGTGRAWAVYDSARFSTHPLKIPLGPFRGGDQQKIAATLVEKAPAARIDSWTRSVGRAGQ